jgi:hypothetical protein
MREQVYKAGFPKAARLITFISIIAVLGFMATISQGFTNPEKKALQEQAYQESIEQFENLFVMAVR